MISKKIAIILPYFGKLPNYFNFVLESMGKNIEIDFLIFTDDKTHYVYSSNISIQYMTFEKMRDRIQYIFNFPICLKTPYKLCDFKPAYGEVFEKELEDYDFWGYCDPDVVFGNISHFIDDELLSRYDKLYVKGHFSLYRNTPTVNSTYRDLSCGQKYTEVFSNDDIYVFDENEEAGVNRKITERRLRLLKSFPMADISPWHFGMHIVKSDSNIVEYYKNSVFVSEKSGLFRVYLKDDLIYKEEFMYIHLQKCIMSINISNQTDAYIIKSNSFCGGIISENALLNANVDKPFYKLYDRLKYRIVVCRIKPYWKILRSSDWSRVRKALKKRLNVFN